MGNFQSSIYSELESLCHMAIDAILTAKEKIDLMDKVYLESGINSKNTALSGSLVKNFTKELSYINLSFFRNLHSFIICCANISKLLYMDKGDRGELKVCLGVEAYNGVRKNLKNIRKELKIDDSNNSFHRKNRGLRNYVEHFDKVLIKTAAKEEVFSTYRICKSYNLENMANKTTEKNYLRSFVREKEIYLCQGEKYNIGKMKEDVFKLFDDIKKIVIQI